MKSTLAFASILFFVATITNAGPPPPLPFSGQIIISGYVAPRTSTQSETPNGAPPGQAQYDLTKAAGLYFGTPNGGVSSSIVSKSGGFTNVTSPSAGGGNINCGPFCPTWINPTTNGSSGQFEIFLGTNNLYNNYYAFQSTNLTQTMTTSAQLVIAGSGILETNLGTFLGPVGQLTLTINSTGSSASYQLTLSVGTQAPAAPVIYAVNPSAGITNGGTLVLISGANFGSNATVSFGSNPSSSVTFLNSTNLTALTAASTPGQVGITISNSNGAVTLSNAFLFVAPAASGSNLLVNGDFNALPVIGAGQSDLDAGDVKSLSINSSNSGFSSSISGIVGWTYALPNNAGTASDHGLARPTAFGDSSGPRMAQINNWGRMMSQTVNAGQSNGFVATAQIQFGTAGSDTDGGRAGTFFLVAGEAASSNLDIFSSRSIILASNLVGNSTFGATLNTSVSNHILTNLTLTHIFTLGDPAMTLPLTVAFRAETYSVGQTFWDNASLTVVPATHAPLLQNFNLSNGTFSLGVSDLYPSQTVILERSSDLISWWPLATNLATAQTVSFTNQIDTNDVSEFYRVVVHY